MSRLELRDADFASPLRARSLMCSYCRSRFALHACCGIENPFRTRRRSLCPTPARTNAEGLAERRSSPGCDARSQARTQGASIALAIGATEDAAWGRAA